MYKEHETSKEQCKKLEFKSYQCIKDANDWKVGPVLLAKVDHRNRIRCKKFAVLGLV